MRNRVGIAILAGVALGASLLLAETRINYLNGVPYVFPATQGAAGKVLINDGAGNLSWATAPTVAELWAGSIIFSNVPTCPAGFTRKADADGRYLRASASGGSLGGSNSHGHSITGTSGSQGVTITGGVSGSAGAVSGTTSTTSINHSHSSSSSNAYCAGGSNSAITSCSSSATDPSHSHGAGTLYGNSHSHAAGDLAGSAHTHDAGSFAAGSATLTPLYYGVVICVKD